MRGREAALASEVFFAAAGPDAADAPGAWGRLDARDGAVVVTLGIMCPRPIGVIGTGRDVCPDVERAIPGYF